MSHIILFNYSSSYIKPVLKSVIKTTKLYRTGPKKHYKKHICTSYFYKILYNYMSFYRCNEKIETNLELIVQCDKRGSYFRQDSIHIETHCP